MHGVGSRISLKGISTVISTSIIDAIIIKGSHPLIKPVVTYLLGTIYMLLRSLVLLGRL